MTAPANQVDAARGAVRVGVDLDVHSRDAVFAAAYAFIGSCYVWMDKDDDGRLVVELRPQPGNDRALEDLAGQFGNELLAQSARALVRAQNADLVQAIVRRSLIGAGAASGAAAGIDLAELEALELEDEPFDDPLGIAMSWEQKYGKSSPDSADAAAGGTRK